MALSLLQFYNFLIFFGNICNLRPPTKEYGVVAIIYFKTVYKDHLFYDLCFKKLDHIHNPLFGEMYKKLR